MVEHWQREVSGSNSTSDSACCSVNLDAEARHQDAEQSAALGGPFRPGARTKASKASMSRWASTVKRRIRARRLGARLGMRIFRKGIVQASNYGATMTQAKARCLR